MKTLRENPDGFGRQRERNRLELLSQRAHDQRVRMFGLDRDQWIPMEDDRWNCKTLSVCLSETTWENAYRLEPNGPISCLSLLVGIDCELLLFCCCLLTETNDGERFTLLIAVPLTERRPSSKRRSSSLECDHGKAWISECVTEFIGVERWSEINEMQMNSGSYFFRFFCSSGNDGRLVSHLCFSPSDTVPDLNLGRVE